MRVLKRLTKIYNNSKEIDIDDNSKIIIMSDVHRGDGNCPTLLQDIIWNQ
jgi:hypothetical protein